MLGTISKKRLLWLLPIFGLVFSNVRAEKKDRPNNNMETMFRTADSLFNIPYNSIIEMTFEEMNKLLWNRTGAFAVIAARTQGLSLEERKEIDCYKHVKLLRCKDTYMASNPWAQRHPDALRDWLLEGQSLNDPYLDKLNDDELRAYVVGFLRARVGFFNQGGHYINFGYYSGKIDAAKYLLQGSFSDRVKDIFFSAYLRADLDRNALTPEVNVLEPYIKKAFKNPKLNHYYDSLLVHYHAYDQGRLAPDIVLNNYNGKTVRLSDFRGKKVVIDMWAIWCTNCIKNMPSFDSIATRYKDSSDYVFLNISLDGVDTDNEYIGWRKFVESHHMDPVMSLCGTPEQTAVFMNNYSITGVPRYMVIDKNGRILMTHSIYPLDPEFLWCLRPGE